MFGFLFLSYHYAILWKNTGITIMAKLPSLKDLSREELEELYKSLYIDYLDLEEENEKLTFVAVDAVKQMKDSNTQLENNQRIIDELLKLVHKHIDQSFSLDDIPKFLN
jgi:hypothetical protein